MSNKLTRNDNLRGNYVIICIHISTMAKNGSKCAPNRFPRSPEQNKHILIFFINLYILLIYLLCDGVNIINLF